MNSGKQQQSPAQQQQQQQAASMMQAYARNELPALGYAIRSTAATEPGRETLAAGQGAQGARVLGGQAMQQAAAGSSNAGALPGSGAFASRVGSVLPRTALASSIGETAGRMGQKANYLAGQGNLVATGNQMLSTANQGLVTAGGVQGDVNAAQTQADAARSSQVSGLGTAALVALA